MSLLLVILASLTPPAPRYDCASLKQALESHLREAEAHPIPLTNPPKLANGEIANESCDDFERASNAIAHPVRLAERGTLGGRRVAVWTDGPSGSGHFSTVTIAVEHDGQPVGACVTTSTSGWRNLSDSGHRQLGSWRKLVRGQLMLWDGVEAGVAEYESLIAAIVYRLRGDVLALDRAATLREIARMGRIYADDTSARPGDDTGLAMHRAAAAAYRAVAAQADCR